MTPKQYKDKRLKATKLEEKIDEIRKEGAIHREWDSLEELYDKHVKLCLELTKDIVHSLRQEVNDFLKEQKDDNDIKINT